MAATGAPSGSTSALDTTSTKDSFIPVFDGLPASYQEYRKRINVYFLKMKLQKRTAEAVLNLIGSLQGTAWKLVEDFDLSKVEEPDAFKEVLAILDKAFQYDARVQLPSDFDGYFSHLSRRPGQTLLQYVTEHDEKLRKVEAHGIQLPPEVQGWMLLKRANVTKEQRQLILTHAPKLEKNKVQEALYLILGQDHKAAIVHTDRRQLPHRPRHRGYAAYDEDAEWTGDFEEEGGFYGDECDEYDPDLDEIPDDSGLQFDQDAVYYQGEQFTATDELSSIADGDLDVAEYDSAFATYLDARRRFQDLKLSRGYLPVVALTDPSSMPSSNATSPGSPHRKGKGPSSPKGGKGGRKGSGKGNFRPGGKARDPRGRAEATGLFCVRCGGSGHQAAQCNKPQKHTSSSGGPPLKKPHVEGMAVDAILEHGHVIFEDRQGVPRVDCAMLDPGASAYLMGTGPLMRYVEHLKSLGYDTDTIKMTKTHRVFHFGGDHSAECHWVAQVPVFVNNGRGFIAAFIIRGETPMLIGRPIIEALGLIINFCNQTMMFSGQLWRECTLGRHGEYLLPLTEDFSPELLASPPAFDLTLSDSTPHEAEFDNTVDFLDYLRQEGVPQGQALTAEDKESIGEKKITQKFWKTLQTALSTEESSLNAYVTSELHQPPRPRLVWEVYAGRALLSKKAEELGCATEVFGLETGWNFDLASHRRCFLQRLQEELPDEVFMSPKCALWSKMQAINAVTVDRQQELCELRQEHHDTHLRFCRKIYKCQALGGRHATLEQPAEALSWKTTALKDLPGLHTTFDQCRYGSYCMDADGVWQLVRKATSLRTTKHAVAQAMSLRCTKDHPHCHLEGNMPGGLSRTRYMENYQEELASALAVALAVPEKPSHWESALAVEEPKVIQGQLIQLMADNKADAVRTVQRLHRNLGHPSTFALVEMLESRGASEAVLNVARSYQCTACLTYKKPNQVAPSSAKVVTKFNQSVQADVLWLKSGENKFPILSVVDEGTRYLAAVLLPSEKSEDYVLALERHWCAHFGCPQRLVTDEGRGWLSSVFQEWTDRQAILHVVAPGEAHEQLALVERRHAVLRKALELYMNDYGTTGANAIREALSYVVPQLNSNPSTSGYSPSQWVLGQQPQFPGELLGTSLAPMHLESTFEEELNKRNSAKIAIIHADTDQRLRRALLRKYAGTNAPLQPGMKCFYWRDARAADLIKIRWKGPATVILREDDADQRPKVYWIAHKSQLLRCAPHHVRPEIGKAASTALGDLQTAKDLVKQLKSRGVTRFIDLEVVNKRNIDDVASDEELLDDLSGDELEPPAQRRRLIDPEQLPPMPSGEADDEYSPEAEITVDQGGVLVFPSNADEVTEVQADLPLEVNTMASPSNAEPQAEPSQEPSPRSPRQIPRQQLDPETLALYQPAGPEDFAAQRLRYDRQETLQFGLRRPRTFAEPDPVPRQHGAGPYDKTGCLVRHHAVPRRTNFDPQQMSEEELKQMPVPLDKLEKMRVSVRRFGSEVKTKTDSLEVGPGEVCAKAWTGYTVFQLVPEAQKAVNAHVKDVRPAKKVAKQQKIQLERQVRRNTQKGDLKERDMTLEDRLQFQQAKMKELRSFFENGVWTFQTTKEADPQRTLTSRMLLKWSKNADGSPRAKARLVVRGYADVDALRGELDTASPASTRLSRTLLLSISACLGWSGWSADVSTAFLQGLPQERRLWIQLPADALRLLGADQDTRMFLHKPVYGQLDAPRRWFLEACRRLKGLSWEPHPLDPCFWRLYEKSSCEGTLKKPVRKLCGLLCLHVDDMLGTGDPQSATYSAAEKALKEAFNFRTWQQDEPFEYCGAQMSREPNGTWMISHKEYIHKIAPLAVEKGRATHQPMSPKEVTALRGLLGSLQWPAVQSSPHLQASTSLLCGEMSAGNSSTLMEANRLLRFAKTNSDVHLRYAPIGSLEDLRLSCMFDAAHGVRHDGSSQGGYVIFFTHKDAFTGVESDYHLIDWKSFKLPRVARSSLSAETQSAGQAADSVDFIVRFWHLLLNPDDSLKETLDVISSPLQPVMITDAKALYDSYHRPTVNHSAIDKRTMIEIKVMQEQVESVGGSLKWISSERQFGDGLTKIQARQLMADRLRHGRIKFTWDPQYQASKKKTKEEREKSRTEFSTPTTTTTSNFKNPKPTRSTMEETEDSEMHEHRPEDYQREPALTFEEPFDDLSESIMVSQNPEAFSNEEVTQNDLLLVEPQVLENSLETEELYVEKNAKTLVESYASHVGRGIVYVMMFLLMPVAKALDVGTDLGQCMIEDETLEETWSFETFLLCTFLVCLQCLGACLVHSWRKGGFETSSNY